MRILALAVVAGAVLCAPQASAIITRHDVDDWRYVQYGDEHRGPVVQLGLPASDDHAPMLYSGMGTLIAPDWVVTAAHATQYDNQSYANDIALIHLARPVRAPEAACLYEASDEAGKIVTLVGSGMPGNGRDGPSADPDGRVRGATVRVGTAEETILRWLFHAPRTRGVTPLEGISAPGDSGGPALIETRAGFCVAGVSSSQRVNVELDEHGQPLPGQAGEGHYGVTEVYTRVSRFVRWIRETMTVA